MHEEWDIVCGASFAGMYDCIFERITTYHKFGLKPQFRAGRLLKRSKMHPQKNKNNRRWLALSETAQF